jgi:hypothetical protein
LSGALNCIDFADRTFAALCTRATMVSEDVEVEREEEQRRDYGAQEIVQMEVGLTLMV